MQTLSPTISSTTHLTTSPEVTKPETNLLSAIAQSQVLQISLSDMDASLNDELDRYRHWQANGQTISYLNPFRPRAVSTQSIWTSPNMLLSETLSPIASSTEANSDRRTIQMPVMPPIGQSPNISAVISAAELHRYTGQNLDSLENLGLDEAPPYIDFGIETNSPTMAKVPEPDDDEILQSFADDYANDYQNSINQETEVPAFSAPPPQSALRSLMNPVGIISLLLLLGSSAAVGYLLVDPSGMMKFFKPDARPKTAQTDSKNEDLGKDINLQNPQKANDSGVPFVPFAGDKTQSNQAPSGLNSNKTDNKNNKTLTNPAIALSSSSFVSSTPLRTVPSAALPSISIAPLPPALYPLDRSYESPARKSYEAPPAYSEPVPRNVSTRSTKSTPAAVSTPSLINNAPAASPSTAYVAPITNVAPNSSNASVKYAAPLSSAPAAASSYRVVVENSYAAGAQQVERDAYVRPSDGQVQVGSYRDQSSAQNRIEQLRRQGIPARIE